MLGLDFLIVGLMKNEEFAFWGYFFFLEDYA